MTTIKLPHGLGWMPDPEKKTDESPDWVVERAKLALTPPPAASAKALVMSILDQGGLGSCVANAAAQAIRASHLRQGATAPQLASRLFLYYAARAYDHMTKYDVGTHLRTCFMACNKFGFPPEGVWPYTDDDSDGAPFMRMPSTLAFHEASDQKSPTIYRRIIETGYDRLDVIKAAIAADYLVCFGTDVSNDFAHNVGTKSIILPPTNQSIAGGHAMCFCAYSGDVFTVVNSWGEDFGNNGFCYFAPEYVAWDGTRDLWIVEEAPIYSWAA